MAKRGECVIRALWSDELGYWFAIEGSHRCAAADELGIEIQIHDIGSDDGTWSVFHSQRERSPGGSSDAGLNTGLAWF